MENIYFKSPLFWYQLIWGELTEGFCYSFRHDFNFVVITCKAPKNGFGTILVDPEVSAVFGEEYSYTCVFGYTTEDKLTVKCVADDTWSLPPPNCTGK